jgi:uncharacterized protein
MTVPSRQAAIALTSLLIGACASSPPVRYFILDPVPPASGAPRPSTNPVQIVTVHLPPALDRRQIVREAAPNQLSVSRQDRWGAPLPDMTQRVLSQDLMLRLSPGAVVLPNEPAPKMSSAVSLDLVEFGVSAAGAVVLEGSWSLLPGGSGGELASHHFRFSRDDAGHDSESQARVMSLLLGQLADSIAAELARSA